MYPIKPKRVFLLLILAAIAFHFAGIAGAREDSPNCCNAPGWECAEYGEWVDGYYAYIRGECPEFVPQSVPPADSGSESVVIGKWSQSVSYSRQFAAEAAANSWTASLGDDDLPEPVFRPLTELPDETTPAEAVAIRNENIRYLFTCFCAVKTTRSQ